MHATGEVGFFFCGEFEQAFFDIVGYPLFQRGDEVQKTYNVVVCHLQRFVMYVQPHYVFFRVVSGNYFVEVVNGIIVVGHPFHAGGMVQCLLVEVVVADA